MKRGAPPHEVRLIAGRWRRTPLRVPDLPGLRPTPGRVRETLFNWLGDQLAGSRCLDAFAGTGALGLEAASRGAASVLLVEQAPALVQALQALVARLEGAAAIVQVRRGDGVAALAQAAPGSLDAVFLDPPFDAAALFPRALSAAAAALAPGGRIYLEAPAQWTDAALAPFGLTVARHLQAGAVHAHLLARAAPGPAP